MGQYHIKYQLYMKEIKLLYNMNMFVKNTIVQECLHNAMYNANTVIGYKLAFFEKILSLICLKMILIIVYVRCILQL